MSTTIGAAPGSSATRSARGRCWRSTRTSAGTSPSRANGCARSPRSNPPGSRGGRRPCAAFDPCGTGEPTSRDDIRGQAAIARAVAPIRVATGEHVHNRVMFKQFLQAQALSICQVDACRLGGVNEVVAVLLRAAKFDVPVCPHAGGVGLCELVQHLSAVDFIAISGTREGRMIEYVDHLHEHFLDPVVISQGSYRLPSMPGYSAEMRPESLARYAYPGGSEWVGG